MHKNNLKNLGFSLMETIVAVAIFALVSIGTVLIISLVFTVNRQQGNLLSDNDAARKTVYSIINDLRNASMGAGGEYALDSSSNSQQVIFYVKNSNSSQASKVRYYLNGQKMYKGITIYDSGTKSYNSSQEQISFVQDRIVNTTTPIFYYYNGYYDGSSTTASLLPPLDVTNVKYVKIVLQVKNSGGLSSSSSFTVSAAGTIRNLKSNLTDGICGQVSCPPLSCQYDSDCGTSNSCTTYTCNTSTHVCSVSTNPPVNGSWSAWSPACNTCGGGSQSRSCIGASCGGTCLDDGQGDSRQCPAGTSAPNINSFYASPSCLPSGGNSTLTWSVDCATSLSINHGIGDVTGRTSTSIYPSGPTTYTLTATNGNGTSYANTYVGFYGYGDITVSDNNSAPVGGSGNFTVSIPNPAPPGGITLTLESSDPTVFSVSPSTMFFAACDLTSQPGTIIGIKAGSGNIKMHAAGFPDDYGSVTIY